MSRVVCLFQRYNDHIISWCSSSDTVVEIRRIERVDRQDTHITCHFFPLDLALPLIALYWKAHGRCQLVERKRGGERRRDRAKATVYRATFLVRLNLLSHPTISGNSITEEKEQPEKSSRVIIIIIIITIIQM